MYTVAELLTQEYVTTHATHIEDIGPYSIDIIGYPLHTILSIPRKLHNMCVSRTYVCDPPTASEEEEEVEEEVEPVVVTDESIKNIPEVSQLGYSLW
jgi:hypothetical protein